MTIETAILDIDNQGEGKKVLTGYEPHTISIVGVNALGVNINKVKSKSTEDFLETDKGKKLMTKVAKAKALDKKKTGKELTEEEHALIVEDSEEVKDPEQLEGEGTEGDEETPVVEPEEETGEEGEVVPDIEETSPEVNTEAPEAEVVPEVEESEPFPEPVIEVEVAPEGEKGDKAKSFTSSERITAQNDILKGVHALVEKIHKAIPDAGLWEITDMVYNSIWKVEDAIWSAENSEWNDIYEEVSAEVTGRVNKAKALKVAEEGSLEDKIKALEAVDPSLAAMMQVQLDENKVNKAKALAAEESKNKLIRAKALEQGAIDFKRIATDDNTTDNIVDAMASIAVSDEAAHTVISKALKTASAITMGGDLFGDVGSSDEAILLSESEYVAAKAKSLVDANGGEIAAAKATVRQSEEYRTLYK